jgi:hypothetical protein
MTTTWRPPLSAHVCTTADAPAIGTAGIFLETAPEKYAKANVLMAKYLSLKPGTYREALWDGWYALKEEADELLKHAISCGALLHYGCPRALAVAKAARKLRTQRLRLEAEVPTC